jgi:nitrate/nitrite-specific signal transduction histidine kinase
MRDRIEAIHGTLSVVTTPGGGTRVVGAVPSGLADEAAGGRSASER